MTPFTKTLSVMSALLFAFVFFISCKKELSQKDNSAELQRTAASSALELTTTSQSDGRRVYVSNVDELYIAVNDPANEGVTIVLAPGTYILSATNPNIGTNKGRLELQKDMSLLGQPGNKDAVVIDISALPRSSVQLTPNFRTGAVRLGNGSHTIEWMTIQSNGINQDIRSLIQTDIVATPIVNLRVAHTVLKGAGIGLNIVNRTSLSNGRTIEAEVEDNEISGNHLNANGSGLRIQGQQTNDGDIKVVMRNNYIYDNKEGVLAFSEGGTGNKINIKSYNDKIEGNAAGFFLVAGLANSAINTENNSLIMEAYGTTIINNSATFTLPSGLPGNVFATAGSILSNATGSISNNILEASFSGCPINDNNGAAPFNAYGAFSDTGMPPTGVNNSCVINLIGISKRATVGGLTSFPAVSNETNIRTVNQ